MSTEANALLESIRELREGHKELREAQKQTDEQLKQTDEQLKRLGLKIGELTGGWGEFVENLVGPSVVSRMSEAGLKVEEVYENPKAKRNGQVVKELDLVLGGEYNGGQAANVIVSIKSKVQAKHVDEHVKDIQSFYDYYHRFKPGALLGAIAGVGFAPGADKYAERQGLFVIRSSDEVAEVINTPGFRPKLWSPRA